MSDFKCFKCEKVFESKEKFYYVKINGYNEFLCLDCHSVNNKGTLSAWGVGEDGLL